MYLISGPILLLSTIWVFLGDYGTFPKFFWGDYGTFPKVFFWGIMELSQKFFFGGLWNFPKSCVFPLHFND
jgi:hypothetical protein